jgi:hypothetical protein
LSGNDLRGNVDSPACVFAAVSIAEVERLQMTSAYQPEFAITPPRD